MIYDGEKVCRLLHPEDWTMDAADYLRALGYDPPDVSRVDDGAPRVAAEVSGGYWVARCFCPRPRVPGTATQRMHGGSIVWVSFPYMWCPRCENRDLLGAWRPVELPPEEVRAGIERILEKRPDPVTRAWVPGETLDVLRRENLQHGLAVA